MRWSVRNKALYLVPLVATLLLSSPPGHADTSRLDDGVQRARQYEAQGQWEMAGSNYLGLIGFAAGDRAVQQALGRRGIACLTIATNRVLARDGMGTDGLGCEPLRMLVRGYETMRELEPDNPTWPYLTAAYMCSQGRYVDARSELQKSLRAGGGQPSVRGKAKQLLAHINSYANSDMAKMTAEDAAAVRCLLSGQAARNFGPVTHSSGGGFGTNIMEQNRKWNESTAKQNAWNSGDMGALNRMNSGSATDADKSRYGGY